MRDLLDQPPGVAPGGLLRSVEFPSVQPGLGRICSGITIALAHRRSARKRCPSLPTLLLLHAMRGCVSGCSMHFCLRIDKVSNASFHVSLATGKSMERLMQVQLFSNNGGYLHHREGLSVGGADITDRLRHAHERLDRWNRVANRCF